MLVNDKKLKVMPSYSQRDCSLQHSVLSTSCERLLYPCSFSHLSPSNIMPTHKTDLKGIRGSMSYRCLISQIHLLWPLGSENIILQPWHDYTRIHASLLRAAGTAIQHFPKKKKCLRNEAESLVKWYFTWPRSIPQSYIHVTMSKGACKDIALSQFPSRRQPNLLFREMIQIRYVDGGCNSMKGL